MANSSKTKINWSNTLFLTLTPIASIILMIQHFRIDGLHLPSWIIFFFFYWATGLGITAGYHRLFSHRAYKANAVVRFFYLVFGAAAFQNSALKWCSDHRIHHKDVDTKKDPYNINQGFFHAHMGWIMKEEKNTKLDNVNDLRQDKLIMWQHNYYIPLAVFVGFILPTIIGYYCGSALGGLALAGVFRVVFVHHMTFFINSLCHCVGTQPYSDSHSARDSFIMAPLTFGEGYHNFHHEFQADYRNGIRWYHFDPTKWLIKTLSFIGMAKKLRVTPPEQIFKAKLLMQEKKKADASHSHISNLRETIIKAYLDWQELKRDYQLKKKLSPSKLNLDELRKQMVVAKLELEMLKKKWEFELAKLSLQMA